MALCVASWNIKQLADKSKKAYSVLGHRDVDWMAAIINAIAPLPDVVVIMEIMTRTGARGLTQIARALGPPWMPMAMSNNAYKGRQPDRYGVLWRDDTVEFRGATYPTGTLAPATQAQMFPNRAPGLFHFRTRPPMPAPSPAGIDFAIVCLHGPEPLQNGGLDAARAMSSLATISSVATPSMHTFVCGDFNVDEIADQTATPSLYQAIESAGPGYRRAMSGIRTSYKDLFTSPPLPGTPGKNAFDNVFAPAISTTVGVDHIDFVTRAGPLVPPPAGPLQPYGAIPSQTASWAMLLHDLRNRVSDHMPVAVAVH